MTPPHINILMRVVAALAAREDSKELRMTEAELSGAGVCGMMIDQATGELVLRWFDPEANPGGAEAMVKAAAAQLAKERGHPTQEPHHG